MNEMLQWAKDTTLEEVVTRLNAALGSVPDKDWNYSRISLSMRALDDIPSPYVLWPEDLDPVTKNGQADLKALTDEVRWGERHSSELGVLEIISLRTNKALLKHAPAEPSPTKRTVVRIEKKQLLAEQGIRTAIWYNVNEVAGEDFDSR